MDYFNRNIFYNNYKALVAVIKMFIARDEIIKRIKEEKLVENVGIDAVQQSGVDLSIDRLYIIKSSSSLYKDKKEMPEVEEVVSDIYTIKSNEYYLLRTKEWVNMPKDLVAFILPRSTLFRCGVSLRTAVVDPGYKGYLTLGIKNESKHNFKLERYARVAQIVFAKVFGNASLYSGDYQFGKVV